MFSVVKCQEIEGTYQGETNDDEMDETLHGGGDDWSLHPSDAILCPNQTNQTI